MKKINVCATDSHQQSYIYDEFEDLEFSRYEEITTWDIIIAIPILLVCGFFVGLWYIITQT